MEQYCLYLRKSRSDQDAERRGEDVLASHERQLMSIAKRNQHNITKIFREVVSGESIANRPEAQEMLNEVEEGIWTGVYVMEVERLARGNTKDQGVIAESFKYSGTKIITPIKTYDPDNEFDEEYFEFGLYMSRREYKTINRRQQRGRIDSAKEGYYLGSIAPYGYKKIKLDNGKPSLEILPDQATVIKMIFELYTAQDDSRIGTGLIARKLNELHIPAQKGGLWVTASVRDIIRNPVYCGKIRWNRRPVKKVRKDGVLTESRPNTNADSWILVEGKHEGIITESEWNAAQELMDKNPATRISKNSTMKNPLSGLIRCALCGRAMVRRPFENTKHPFILCAIPECKNVSTYLYLVEDKILEGLGIWLQNYKAQWESKKPSKKNSQDNVIAVKQNVIAILEGKLKDLQQQDNNIHDLLEQKVYTIEKYLERSREITERISETRKELEQAFESLSIEQQRTKAKVDIIPKIEHVLNTYYQTDNIKMKNNLLKSVLDHATYHKEFRNKWGDGDFDGFTLNLYPKLPK